MSDLAPETVFLLLWIGFMVLGLTCAFIVLFLAVRSRQFSDQDRARYLPLRSGIPGNSNHKTQQTEQQRGKRHDPQHPRL